MDPTLYRAATSGNVLLLQQVAETNPQLLFSKAPQQDTALHIAIKFGHVDFTKQILKLCGELLNAKNSKGDTALHCAARAGSLEVVQILLDYVEEGGSVIGLLRTQNTKGDTALHEALRNRQEDIAIKMLQADPRLPFVVNNAKESSFLVAVKEDMEEIVRNILSIDGSADSGEIQAAAISSTSVTADHIVLPITAVPPLTVKERTELIRMQDNTGRTALHYAAWRNNATIVRMILKTDSNHVPYMLDNNGQSPLHSAVAFGMQWSMLELLEHCPDTIQQFDRSGRNVLQIALLNHRFAIFRKLLELPHIGGLINGLDQEENAPTDLACREDKYTSPVGNSRQELVAMRNEDAQIVSAHDLVHRGISSGTSMAGEQRQNFTLKAFAKEQNQVSVVMASLIATVTFAAAFTLPGGYRGSGDLDPGTAILASKPAFKAFLILDALAMSFSLLAIFCYFFGWGIDGAEKFVQSMLNYGYVLTFISSIFMLYAFAAGVFVAVEPKSKGLAIAVLVICSLLPTLFLLIVIGLPFLVCYLIRLLKDNTDH